MTTLIKGALCYIGDGFQQMDVLVKDGKIDFAFMDNFISAIKKLAVKDVVKYSDAKIDATKKVVSC